MKNKPKTIEQFVVETIEPALQVPPRPAKMAARGPWAHMNLERKAYSAKLIAARKGNTARPKIPGKPRSATNAQWAEVQETARLDAKSIIQKMKDAGQMPDDPRAALALELAVTTLRSATTAKDVAALGRLILDFAKSKPVQKTEVSMKTAEDWLDEMSGDAE